MSEKTINVDEVLAELARLGEIASGLIDGEEVKAIVLPSAMEQIIEPDPNHPYMAGDSFDVDMEVFLRVKKLLLRIERLGELEVDSSVWIPVRGRDEATVILHNGTRHRWYIFGQLKLATPPELREVFESGRIRLVPPGEGDTLATALAPIRDSLGDVIGAVELTTQLEGPPPAGS